MKNIIGLIFAFISIVPNTLYSQVTSSTKTDEKKEVTAPISYDLNEGEQQTENEKVHLPYEIPKKKSYQIDIQPQKNSLYLKDPKNIERSAKYNEKTKEYDIDENIGDTRYQMQSMPVKEYIQYDINQAISRYWREHSSGITEDGQRKQLIPEFYVKGEVFADIFGSGSINIRPQGFLELDFGITIRNVDNPTLSERLRKITTFDFNQRINASIEGTIGDKVRLGVNYNTDATFDFENRMSLEYQGKEDEIIKDIQAGNVSMPSNNSLIQGGTNLFGVRTELQFGKLNVQTIMSQQKGETQVIQTEGGAIKSEFDIDITDYDANRHYFLSQYFYENYDKSLSRLPVVQSNITITKIEVWVTNKASNFTQSRNLVAFTDLGERGSNRQNNEVFSDTPGLGYPDNTFPNNESNSIYKEMTTSYSGIRDIAQVTTLLKPLENKNFKSAREYEKLENARLLNSSEYRFNPQLGYISLNQALNNDEVLAVAYEYIANGKTYQVGEFSTDGVNAPDALFVKLLKSTTINPHYKNWTLMMKNIYDLGAYQLSAEDFRLNVVYYDTRTGTRLNYMPDGPYARKILLDVLNLDNTNFQGDQQSDGVFDFLQGITIDINQGKVIFPNAEPFGNYLDVKLKKDPQAQAKYVFQALYDSTQIKAKEEAGKNKFRLQGSYKGSSNSEISLNSINVSKGSVRVMAGGKELIENVDYTVDYALGRIKIINQGLLESGTPITVSNETEDLFSVSQKTLLGAQFNYAFNDHFNLGASLMYLHEKANTNKIVFGDDPISNLMLGLNGSYQTDSWWLTKMVNKIPLISTNEISNISIEADYAQLIPGTTTPNGEEDAAYLDDFESAQTNITLKAPYQWHLASVPEGSPDFPEGNLINDLANGYNRARLTWYTIDPVLQRNFKETPPHLANSKVQQSGHYIREVYQDELFPDKQLPEGQPSNIPTFDLSYYPTERGPYNFETQASTVSRGLNKDGTLKDPETRWGGIMRSIETNDFESANIEYIEFWVMDPFLEDTLQENTGGDLYFDLGSVSEDVLKDSRKSLENALPADGDYESTSEVTQWGRVTKNQAVVNAFDNDANARQYQDVGLDGLPNSDEANFFTEYLTKVKSVVSGEVYQNIVNDPSNDNYHYYRGSDYDAEERSIIERYHYFNNPDGNSPTDDESPESYPTSATNEPDQEDINADNTMSETENYYHYRVRIDRNNLDVGKNYITDRKDTVVRFKDGRTENVTWYQFKIPLSSPDETIGDISDFRSIRFLRMYLKGWEDPVILRFATFDLVRSDWRRFEKSVDNENMSGPVDAQIDVSTVSIEENSKKTPVNYLMPVGIEREIDPSQPDIRELNEQSMSIRVQNLKNGEAVAAYKNTVIDMRRYKTFKLDVHAEALENHILHDDDLTLFLRIGTDYYDNYYEYEVPLSITNPGYYTDNDAGRSAVWPESNRIYIPISIFTDLKLERDKEMSTDEGVDITQLYTKIDEDHNIGKNIVKVKGRPNLGEVQVMMIGIRNPERGTTTPLGTEVWVNEMRLTDMDNEGGWALSARVTGNLADLMTFNVSGYKSTAGFGSIDQNVMQRSMEDYSAFDFSANVEVGKFFPEKWGVRIPMYVGYANEIYTPEFNPLDPDIKLADALDNLETEEERRELKEMVQDFTERKSVNFTNVQVTGLKKEGTPPRFYDLANFSLTYAHNVTFSRNVTTEKYWIKEGRFLLNYNYMGRPKYWEPFKKSKFFGNDFLALIRDFNINIVPNQISFRSDMNSYFNEQRFRDIENPDFIMPSTYVQDFQWGRYYDLRIPLTKSIQIDYSAQSLSRIDFPNWENESLDSTFNAFKSYKKVIFDKIWSGGRNISFNQTFDITYNLPINKFPYFDWITASARYQGTYNWMTSPLLDEDEDSFNLGNTITNTNTMQLNANMNFASLYDKMKYFQEVNKRFNDKYVSRRRQSSRRGRTRPVRKEKVAYSETVYKVQRKKNKKIKHDLGTLDVEINATDSDGERVRGKVKISNDKKIVFTPYRTLDSMFIEVTGEVPIAKSSSKQSNEKKLSATDYMSRVLMTLRSGTINYSENKGTSLTGFLPESKFFGLTKQGNKLAPGLGFVFGIQDDDLSRKLRDNNWLSTDSIISNVPFVMYNNNTLDLRAQLEPIPQLLLDLTGQRLFSETRSEYFLYDNNHGGWYSDGSNKILSGSFSMSIVSVKTAFEKIGGDGVPKSSAFDNFLRYRNTIAQRLTRGRIANPQLGYFPSETNGYSSESPEVLIPAFLAAYTGQSPSRVALDPFPSAKSMRPNWSLQYMGLTKLIPPLNNWFQSISLTHVYRSIYSIGSYLSNPDYVLSPDGYSYAMDADGNFIPLYDITAVSITESFSPLFGLEMTWKNNLTTRLEFLKARSLMLSLANDQLTENLQNEMNIGLGYRLEDLKIFIKQKDKQKSLSNDLNLMLNVGYRIDKTVIRKILEKDYQLSAGQKTFNMKFTADYVMSDLFLLQFYCDYTALDPYVSLSYPTTTTNLGFSLRFTLN